jgi:hypothetical protein
MAAGRLFGAFDASAVCAGIFIEISGGYVGGLF